MKPLTLRTIEVRCPYCNGPVEITVPFFVGEGYGNVHERDGPPTGSVWEGTTEKEEHCPHCGKIFHNEYKKY